MSLTPIFLPLSLRLVYTYSPRSREISTKVGVDSALRNECKGGFATPKHAHGD